MCDSGGLPFGLVAVGVFFLLLVMVETADFVCKISMYLTNWIKRLLGYFISGSYSVNVQ